MRQSHTVVIDKPVGEVFAFTEDPANAPDWAEGIVDLEVLDEPAEGHVGTQYRMTLQEGGQQNTYEGEVTAWEDDRYTRNRVERDGMVMLMDRIYDDLGPNTELTMVVEVEVTGWAKLMAPVIWLMNRFFLAKQASKLKELVEAQG